MLCGWLTETDDADEDAGDCDGDDDDNIGSRDVDVVINDDVVGTIDVCVELICHNGDSGFWKHERKHNFFFLVTISWNIHWIYSISGINGFFFSQTVIDLCCSNVPWMVLNNSDFLQLL